MSSFAWWFTTSMVYLRSASATASHHHSATTPPTVPKTIMCELVNATVARVQSELVRALYKPELLEDLLEEPEELKIKRSPPPPH